MDINVNFLLALKKKKCSFKPFIKFHVPPCRVSPGHVCLRGVGVGGGVEERGRGGWEGGIVSRMSRLFVSR